MASLALNISDSNNGFLGLPDYSGAGGSPMGDMEIAGSVAGTPLSASVSLGNGAMPYDPSNPLFGSLRVGSPQPVTGTSSLLPGLFQGNVLFLVLILWLIFRKK